MMILMEREREREREREKEGQERLLFQWLKSLTLFLQNTLYLVDHGPSGPIRCNRCKAYMNPNCRYIDGGRHYECPICLCNNEGGRNQYSNF